MSMTNLAQPDVTIFLDHAGVIQRAALSPAIRGEALDAWVGRPWVETVESFGSEACRVSSTTLGTRVSRPFGRSTKSFRPGCVFRSSIPQCVWAAMPVLSPSAAVSRP